MSRLFRLIPILLMLLFPAAAIGADLQKGLDAYDIGDYETSLAECQPLADEGDRTAQFCVGRLYANGFGVAMDDALALKYYGLAAEQGHSEAQFNLGVMHSNGWGVPMNEDEGANWFRLAAEQGFVQAQTALASICDSYAKNELAEAYMWYSIAEGLGDINAGFKRDELESRLSEEELLNAKQQASTWLDNFDAKNLHAGRID